MRIARSLLDDIVEHAVRDAPNECCGVVATRAGAATTVHATKNRAATPKMGFDIDGLELMGLIDAIEDAGDDLGAIYHSHTRSAPYPSQTDVNFSPLWPGVEWLIVGVPRRGAGETEVRSYLIEDGRISEVELVVE